MRTGALHKVQHSRMSSASQLITHWQSGVGSRRCRWRLRRVALRNTWKAGPVNAAMFKLKIKMNCCCTFYNIAHPRWLRKITVFWDVTLCISVVTEHAASIFSFKNGSNMLFVRNTGTSLPILWYDNAEESNLVSRIHNNLTDVY